MSDRDLVHNALPLLDGVEASVFVLEADATGRPVYRNINAFGLLRLGKTIEDIRGKTAPEIFGAPEGEEAYTQHLAALRDGKGRSYAIFLPVDAGLREFETHLSPVHNPDGSVACIVGTSLDATNATAVSGLQTGLDEITREMSAFVSFAAHDLRTPMRQVRAIAEMLREDFEDLGEGKVELIEMLESVASHATALISDILCHAQATGAKEDRQLFDFGELVEKISAALNLHEGDSINCHSQGRIVGDRAATQVVLYNLVDNARKHACDAMPLELDVCLGDAGGDIYSVTVRDNGKGFPAAALDLLSGGEFRAESGFGLQGIRQLVRARGGSITVGNHADGGSEVCFRLPGTVLPQDPEIAVSEAK